MGRPYTAEGISQAKFSRGSVGRIGLRPLVSITTNAPATPLRQDDGDATRMLIDCHLAVVGSMICDTCVIALAGKPDNSACLRIPSSSSAR